VTVIEAIAHTIDLKAMVRNTMLSVELLSDKFFLYAFEVSFIALFCISLSNKLLVLQQLKCCVNTTDRRCQLTHAIIIILFVTVSLNELAEYCVGFSLLRL
jgi:hypothetical protein